MSGLTRSSGLARANATITKRTRPKFVSPLNLTPEGLAPPTANNDPTIFNNDTHHPPGGCPSSLGSKSAAALLTAKDLEPFMGTSLEYSNEGWMNAFAKDLGSVSESPVPVLSAPVQMELAPEAFDIIRKLGEGASGTVYMVRHKPTGKVVAKKTVASTLNAELQKQTIRELSFLRTCNCPHIVSFYGATLEDGNTSIAIFMEYLDGGSLDGIYKRVRDKGGCIGEGVLGKISEAVLKGLIYLHGQHIIHRDIKPSNILVSQKGEIKLCDFGVSGELIDSIANTFVGTSYYMAPERIQGTRYAVQSDIWSLGLTLIEAAQNRFPFPPPGHPPLTVIDLLQYIVSMPPPVLTVDEGWSPEMCNFVSICLIKDPQQRPAPRKMCQHAFVVRSSATEVDLEQWMREVWDCKIGK